MRRVIVSTALAGLAALCLDGPTPAALAQGTPPAAAPAKASRPAKPSAIARLPEVTTFALANGLQVAVLPSDAAPIASVQLWIRAGSKDEPRDRRGVAAIVERLMFAGSPRVRTGGHQQLVASLGGFTSSVTDEDATHFVNTVPAEHVAFAIRLESERLRGLLLRPEQVATEREITKDEARQAAGNALTKGFLRLLSAAYTKHPYAWTAIGDVGDLDATTPVDVKKFYDAYYQPNNAMLVVVGQVTAEAVKAAAETYFGPIAKGAEPPRPAASAVEPAQTAPRKEVTEPGQVGLALLGFRVPPAADADIFAVQVASIILGGGDSSRLKSAFRKVDPALKQTAAKDGGLQMFVRQDPGIAIAWGLFVESAAADAVVGAITAEVRALGTKGPTAAELRKAKSQVQSAFVFSLENAEGLADAIGRSWIQTGEPRSFLRDVDRVEAVTAADVKRVVAKYMTPDLTTIIVVPPPTGGK